jgi:hypothetical protein
MLGSLKVTNQGTACDSPYSGRPLPEGALDPTKYYSPKDIFLGDVVAPNAYTITKWCVRDVTVPEFLEMMDVPASVIKHAFERQKLDEACSAGLLSSPPLKILQEVGSMLFGRDEKKFVDAVLDMPVGAEVSFNLRSKLPGMDDIYKDINQAKAAKNDDAATDFALWEEAIMKKTVGLGNRLGDRWS